MASISRQTLARWVIQCGEHLRPLLNLMHDQLLESRIIHCVERLGCWAHAPRKFVEAQKVQPKGKTGRDQSR